MSLLEPGEAANAHKANILKYQAGSLRFRRPHQRSWLL